MTSKNVSMTEKYYIKTRELVLPKVEADAYGIRRVYNRCSDIDYMPKDDEVVWVSGLFNKAAGESVIVESAMKFINGVPLYVSSCIVFYTVEQGNLFYYRNMGGYKNNDGFAHLFN